MTDDINQLAKYRDQVLDECWKLLDDAQRDIIRDYLVYGDRAEEVPMKLRRAQERLMERLMEPEGVP